MPRTYPSKSATTNGTQESTTLSASVLKWWDEHGRKDLPWQQDISPYRVWVSEIMLQQTQVATVVPYFERFMTELPDIATLAAAPEDQVLHLWSGLGYYARARNMHRTAQKVCGELQGVMPDDLDGLVELPGIGRSTAGAIISIAFGKPATILDGNVKRVLARYHGIEGWPGTTVTLKALWECAERHTPAARTAHYSQAMMDLGATVCRRSKPGCGQCPLMDDCLARSTDTTAEIPGKRPRKVLPVKEAAMLLIQHSDGSVLLEKRPSIGIWGGLWSFPEIEPDVQGAIAGQYGLESASTELWETYRHTFSHYHFDIKPVLLKLDAMQSSQIDNHIMESGQRLWYNIADPQEVGLAAPVTALLAKLKG